MISGTYGTGQLEIHLAANVNLVMKSCWKTALQREDDENDEEEDAVKEDGGLGRAIAGISLPVRLINRYCLVMFQPQCCIIPRVALPPGKPQAALLP